MARVMGSSALPVIITNTTTDPKYDNMPVEGIAAQPVMVVGIEDIGGITQVITILDGDGVTTHTLTFTGGVLTGYSAV